MHPLDPNCAPGTPWWLPIVTGVLGLAGSVFAWLRRISIHPELRRMDQRIKRIEDQEEAEKKRVELLALIDSRLGRRGNVQ